jgi:crotonobetainyl-CoA:carnitine CoA-transferase CaiB-like acyl-CoA transferase
VFRRSPSGFWIEKLAALGVPCGPINELDQVFEDPQVKHRGLSRSLPHAEAGRVPSVANPIRMSATPPEERLGPPVLGEHTADVLKTLLALNDHEIADLAAAGTIQDRGAPGPRPRT